MMSRIDKIKLGDVPKVIGLPEVDVMMMTRTSRFDMTKVNNVHVKERHANMTKLLKVAIPNISMVESSKGASPNNDMVESIIR